jgi:pimeloyl-ACP methyl ester carboxylesterase
MTYYPLVNLGGGLAARESKGDGDGILWLHSYALDSSCWSELWDLLPSWHHVGIDLPGHGISLPLAPDTDLAGLAKTLNTVAQDRGLRHVVALSFGCMVALQMAIEAPGAYSALVLGSPLVEHGANDEPFWKRYRELVNMYQMAGHGEFLRGRLMLVEPSPFDAASGRPELWQRLWDIVGRHSFADLRDGAILRLGGSLQSDVRLHGIEAAVLLVLGDRERAGGKRHAERLTRALRDSRRLHLLGAGAHSLIERPDQAASAIEAHLRSHTPAQPAPGGGTA